MAFTTINASETDADSPVNQTLMDKIRENDDYLKGQTDLASRTLASVPNGLGTWSATIGSGVETVLVNNIDVVIPAGASTIACRVYGKIDATNASALWKFHITNAGNDDYASVVVGSTSSQWDAVDMTLTNISPASGLARISIIGDNNSGIDRDWTVEGFSFFVTI